MRSALLFIFLIVLVSEPAAQPYRKPSTNGISGKKDYNRKTEMGYQISVRGGLTQFFGELNGQDMQSVLGIGLGKNFRKEFSLQVDYMAGKVGGEKKDYFNSYFISEFNTLECIAKWDLIEQFNIFEPDAAHCYLYGGIGQIWFAAHAFDLDNGEVVRFTNSSLSARNPLFVRWGPPHGPPGIRKTREGIMPIGTSMDFVLLNHWKMGVDYRFYLVRTDKMDATSGRRLINPEESDSYSNTPNDKFSFISVYIAYQFGKQKHRR